jgi:hypothetical protein
METNLQGKKIPRLAGDLYQRAGKNPNLFLLLLVIT